MATCAYGQPDGTWVLWSSVSSTTTSNTLTMDSVWAAWGDSTTSTATATTIWTSWTTGNEYIRTSPIQVPREEVLLNGISREQYDIEVAVRAAERKKAHEEASARAEKLLVENLSERQLKQYRRFGSFIVYGKNNTRYRIRKGRVANVDVINEQGVIPHRLCFHPQGAYELPDYDVMLAQKLWLEFDENACHKIANQHGSLTGSERVLSPLH